MYIQNGNVDIQTGEHKFILYQDHGVWKILSRAFPRHNTIYKLIADTIQPSAVQGGGWLVVDPDMHSVRAYGKSDKFGSFDPQIADRVLCESLLEHDWTVCVE